MLVPLRKITFLHGSVADCFKGTISRSIYVCILGDIFVRFQYDSDGFVESVKNGTSFDTFDAGNSQKPNFNIIQQSLNFTKRIDLLIGEKRVVMFGCFGQCLVMMRGDKRDNMMNDFFYFMPEVVGGINSLVRRVGIAINILFQRCPVSQDPRTEGV